MNLKKIASALWLAAGLCATSAFAGPPTYPFGARLDPYGYGTKPNHVTDGQMDNSIKGKYNAWKSAAVVNVPTVPGGKAVRFSNQYLAVSEGMGYGMLLAVLMAGHDPEAQALFDSLLRTVRARPAYSIPVSSGGKYLMDWRLTSNGSSQDAAGGGWNAMDGDEDIAMALLMADRQWGSGGTWNYKQEGINTINAIKSWNMKPDGTTKGGATSDLSRTSDYMIGHFRAYAKATGDSFWSTLAIDRSYALIERMQNVYSPGVGLMPDFIIDTDKSDPKPSPGGRGDGTNTEMNYFANAQRNPWRWGTDYVLSGDVRWKGVVTKMMNFFVNKTGGNPKNMAIGYRLNGSDMGYAWPARGLIVGAMNGAQVDPSFQPFLNASWDWINNNYVNDYYDAELSLLSMLVASGNWWNPTPPAGNAAAPKPTVQAATPVAAPAPKPTISGALSPVTTGNAAAIHTQAESGSVSGSGVGVRNDLSGFEGSGFVGGFTNDGDSLTLGFSNVAAGTYDVKIRYQAWGTQQNGVVIDGVRRNESFAGTGAGWATKTISGVQFASGTHAVAIVKDWGYISVDWIELVPTGASNTTGGSAAVPKSSIKAQAESGAASGSGVGTRNNLAGFEGTGFVGGFTNSGDKLTLNFSNLAAGTYNVRVRYHAWGTQQNNVVVNGKSRSESFPASGSMWAIKTLSGVALGTGTNTIAITKDWGHVDIDWIEVTP